MNTVEVIKYQWRKHGVVGTLARLLSNPRDALSYFFDPGEPHIYETESRLYWGDVLTFARPLSDASDDELLAAHQHIKSNAEFRETIERNFARTDERPDRLHSNWRELLYVLVRISKPDVIVETGTYDGLGAAYILQAIEDNGSGRLISIDINDEKTLPNDLSEASAGWLVPRHLRDNWDLRLGDAKEILPEVVDSTTIDCFVHDSLHTEDHMRFEFETATRSLKPGSILLADNAEFNGAFREFSKEKLKNTVYFKSTNYALNDGEAVDDRFAGGVMD